MGSLIRLASVVAAAALVAATPARAEWCEAKSKHFIIDANENPDELRAYAEKLERFDQAVRYIRQMDDPDLTDSERVTIFVLPDAQSVQQLIGFDGARGLYITRASGSFAFVPQRSDYSVQGSSNGIEHYNEDLTPQAIFFHEYAHHLQLQNATVVVPQWVSEGFAEFFATAEVKKDGSVQIGQFPAYRWFGVHQHSTLPIEQILGETYKALDGAQMDTLYARGWLLTHYLTMTDSRRGQMTRYIAGIQNGMTPLDSAKAAFGDLKQLDRDLDEYLAPHRLLGITVDSRVIPIGNVTIRQLGPGEAAIMDVRIHSKRGVNSDTAPGLAAEARRVAERYPNDAAVEGALAEAEYDSKNYAAASSAADRALESNPKDVHAMIYKGRALMALARAQPKSADWDSVRQWFIDANRIDTENAEALELYYLSYPMAGQYPTSNALDALLYAADLAPRDEEVRINAVDALLSENKLAQAKTLLAPLAYAPHEPPQVRDMTMKAMSAISAGDGKAALAILQANGKEPKVASSGS